MKRISKTNTLEGKEERMTRGGHRNEDSFLKKRVKRFIRMRIASKYRGSESAILNKCAEWVFDAPMLKWHFRLKILLKCVAHPSVGLLEERSAFVVGADEKLR